MRVLVTGATGKVGSRLAKRLARRGDHVRALVRDPGRAAGLREHGVEILQGDLLDPGSLGAAVHGVDGVVHCAALYFHSDASEQGHAVNDLGTQRLAVETIAWKCGHTIAPGATGRLGQGEWDWVSVPRWCSAHRDR